MWAIQHTYMKRKQETPEQVRRWFAEAIETIWPVADGSLSFRKSPCIRPNCSACAGGEGHTSYALYGRRGGKRVSIYIPDELAPQIGEAVANGRQLKDLINEAGVRYARALKTQRQKQ
jgi:hypothetical protein